MTYYRLAIQDQQTAKWTWKSTALTSLQALFELLRIYGKRPQISTRVFTASSKEDLNEMLSRQNNNLESGSVTAIQFLHERKMSVPEPEESAWEQHVSAQTVQQGAGIAAWARNTWERHVAAQAKQQEANGSIASSVREGITTTVVPASLGINLQEQKRLEIELGPGGDHDTPYRFTLPIALKERLAWVRLQSRMRAGELAS